VFITPIRGF